MIKNHCYICAGIPELVKGVRLKILCACFVGSNPTPSSLALLV